MSERCKGCAFTKGTEANTEPQNHLKAILCVLAPHPFYCHESTDWKNPQVHGRKTREQLRAIKPRICEGWRTEVRELNVTGYYDENPVITKVYGESALETMDCILTVNDAETKKELWQEFQDLVKGLSKKWKKFRNQPIEVKQ